MEYISVIVPVYNGERHIKRCIDSIEKNTYRNFEIIIVNDGSTDTTSEIVVQLSLIYSNIKVIQIKNRGVSNARNVGIENAKGTYLAFVDADDTVCEDYLEKLLVHIQNLDLVICNYNDISDKRKTVYRDIKYGKYEISEFNNEFMLFFTNELINSPCNKLYKSDIIHRYDIKFPIDINLGEDLIFNIRYLYRCNKLIIIKDALYNYYYVTESLSTVIRRDYLQVQYLLIEELKRYLIKTQSYSNYNETELSFYRNKIYISFVQDIFQNKMENKKKKNFFKEVSRTFKNDKTISCKNGDFQQKIIFYALKKGQFNLLFFFFEIKEKLLKPILKLLK